MAVKTRSKTEHKAILKEAHRRFKRCEEWEATFRPRYVDDVKFCEADAYNMYQWPQEVQDRLKADNRVMLTINRTRQHVLDVLNDARQTKVAIKIRPVRGGASYESAQALEGICRHIEYISSAQAAYQHGLKGAVQGGIGWWRIATDYMGDDSFDQEIFIRRIPDPMSIYLDPDITEFDGSDAKFGFVFTYTPREEYDAQNPGKALAKGRAGSTTFGPEQSWVMAGKVRTAEYFRVVQDTDRLIGFIHPETGEPVMVRESEAEAKGIDKALLASVIDNPQTQIRRLPMPKVEHFRIEGDEIVEEKEWLGIYIPLIRTIGEETVIDGEMDRKGHVRALLDQQRMANYNASASIEFGALQSKIPYIGPLAAFEGVESIWKDANTTNPAYLPFKHLDDDGNPIPAPVRQQPPMGAPVFQQGFRDAIEQMFLASGQNQADFGMPSNEKSGVAIQQRQRQGDNATYHYIDHQSSSITFTGKQLIDLIPKVYDTKRQVLMRDEAGKEAEVTVDPNAPQAYQSQKTGQDKEEVVLNPRLGVYDVQADTGPAYATRRQEAFEAYTTILSQNKELTSLIGDIALRFADFPGAEEAAQRLRRMVPQQALEDGPPPDVIKLQQQIKAMEDLVGELNQKLASKDAEIAIKHANVQVQHGKNAIGQEKNALDAYRAQSDRLSALKDAFGSDPEGVMHLLRAVVDEALATSSAALDPSLDVPPPTAESLGAADPAIPPPEPEEPASPA